MCGREGKNYEVNPASRRNRWIFCKTKSQKLRRLELTEEAIETLERDFCPDESSAGTDGIGGASHGGLNGGGRVAGADRGFAADAKQLEVIDAASRPLTERLASAAVELNDLGSEFETFSQTLQFDPDQAEDLDERMNSWLELKRKHGGDLAAVLAARDSMRRPGRDPGRPRRNVGATRQTDLRDGTSREKEAQALRVLREKRRTIFHGSRRRVCSSGFNGPIFKFAVSTLPNLTPIGDCTGEF